MNGDVFGTYTTDRNGVIQLPRLTAVGTPYRAENRPPAISGYHPQQVEVKDGRPQRGATNRKTSNILCTKKIADTGDVIYGAVFLLYDSNHNPIGQYTPPPKRAFYMDEGWRTAAIICVRFRRRMATSWTPH
jgi:hypothetical protein